jgi:hypothetical protein
VRLEGEVKEVLLRGVGVGDFGVFCGGVEGGRRLGRRGWWAVLGARS